MIIDGLYGKIIINPKFISHVYHGPSLAAEKWMIMINFYNGGKIGIEKDTKEECDEFIKTIEVAL